MRTFIITIKVCHFVFAKVAVAQTEIVKRDSVVRAFISYLDNNPQHLETAVDRFFYFPVNDTVNLKARKVMMTNMVKNLQVGHKADFKPSIFNIVDYDKFKRNKKLFSSGTGDIAILTINEKPIVYFYFVKEKIASLQLLQKGKVSYFLLP